ncbi:MAG: 50S ribosome-binding GTPase [Planctomycetes bacterium]|nr:50S ribosome-binding GTPase [Planctomycetota bacterium]
MPVPPPSKDLIVATLTPPGEGAIATLLLDGDGAWEALARVFRRKGEKPFVAKGGGQLAYGVLADAAGKIVDEVLAAPIDAKSSSTSNPQAEVSCHGGMGATQAALALLLASGARAALPWELEARAHRAARLALPALEARFALARVATARQAELVLAHGGALARWERWGLEAALGARKGEAAWREPLAEAVKADHAQAEPAQRLLRTHRVALVGPVNAGKSTLANSLLRAERSIVSPEPGTTRDRLERPAELRGMSLLLSDSAGLRAQPEDGVEGEGQRRALAAAASADLALLVVDGSRAPEDSEVEALAALAKRPHLLVLNKADRGVHEEAAGLAFALGAKGGAGHEISALAGTGLEALEEAIEAKLLGGEARAGAPFTRRQAGRLAALAEGLQEGLDGSDLVGHIRALVGTRPNEEELAAVFTEAAG